ncbi:MULTISPECIES: hypothetical protein [unclassified Butyrivibrio]|uniref:hypothetical protein n=1 Tax=unclassified Butyrivibrio TaxID=2639466 RepID=UPI00088D188A|nr:MULTISPECIES: hypothetical protein [unclassified Butyrivibrio]SDB33043.1 hypothetical protein SAMN02910263_01606 [Butyrivibrio sp. INlla16]SEL55685.1 hypothetical protein SAMN04487770_11263 [Butyrivibrio sp. ob235]
MKILKSFMAAMIIFLLSANTALAAAATDSDMIDATSPDADIQVMETYEHSSEWGYKYLIAVCQNNTDEDLEVSWDTVSYDANNNILETGSSYSSYVVGRQWFVLYALFLDSDDAETYDYKINIDSAQYIVPAQKDVTLEAEMSSNGKLIIQATNNSDKDISTIQAATLFFDEDHNIVGFEDSYVVNSNYNVKAGETVVNDLTPPDGADTYEIYYTAYRY